MKTPTILARSVIAAAIVFAAAGAGAQTYTKQQLQETYTTYLAQEGFRPETTQAGNVRFRREGKIYVIYVDERDPTFFRLQLLFTPDDKSAAMRAKRVEGANVATGETKVIKSYIDGDGDIVFAAEMFLIVPGDFKTTIARLFRAMDSAYEKYQTKVQSLN